MSGTASFPSRKRLALLSTCTGLFMVNVDLTAVNVAIPSIQANFQGTLDGLVWIIDGYTLTFAALLLLGGAIGDLFGARKAFLWGLALFLVSSLLCGLAPSLGTLILARGLQGAGAAICLPNSLALIRLLFADSTERARAIGAFGAIACIAAGIGPFLGGLLVAKLGWRSIFLINLPIGAAGIGLTLFAIQPVTPDARPLRFRSHFAMALVLSLFSYALIQSTTLSWRSPFVLLAVGLGTVVGLALLRAERARPDPILPGALFANPSFVLPVIVGFLINFTILATLFTFSVYFQKGSSDSFEAGLRILPMTLMMVAGNLLSGSFVARWGSSRAMALGMAAAGLAYFAFLGVNQQTSFWLAGGALALAGFGISFAIPGMTHSVIGCARRSQTGIASALLNVSRQIGSLSGVAVAGAVLANAVQIDGAMHLEVLILFTCCLVAASLSLVKPPSVTQPTQSKSAAPEVVQKKVA